MNLATIRKKNNKTQLQVANELYIEPTTLCNYEKGKSEPNIETLCKLADYYKVSLDELVGRETNNINLEALEPEVKTIIQKILTMNKFQISQAIDILNALTKNNSQK